MRVLPLCCFALLSMGCSFIFVRPPPSEPDQLPYFDCVSNGAAPATDITNAVLDGLLMASALDSHQPELAAGFAVAGAVYAASAIYGVVMTSQCGSAKERLAARLHEIGRDQSIQRAELRMERDALLNARTPVRPQPGGCSRDMDCKGDRICVNALCIYPPPAPTRGTPIPAAPTPAAPIPAAPTPPAPVPVPSGATP